MKRLGKKENSISGQAFNKWVGWIFFPKQVSFNNIGQAEFFSENKWRCQRGKSIMCRNHCNISVQFQFLNLAMVVLKVLREFAGSTTLHGFGHLVSHKTSPKTKIVWTLSLIVAILYASSEMRNSVIGKYTIIFIKTGRLKRSHFQIEIF